MSYIEAIILGIVQGLTEYLPVSSSGHLLIASHFFDITDETTIMPFTIAVHVATVLSTLVILYKEVIWIFKGLFDFSSPRSTYKGSVKFFNDEQNYALNILISMIPIGIVGLCFKDYIESAFSGLNVVGICLIITATLLAFTFFAKPRVKEQISMLDSLIIGIAQAVACLPGLSRSGATIATGLLIGDSKEKLAQFSFLMVIPPILGEALLDTLKIISQGWEAAFANISSGVLFAGMASAFLVGCLACRFMIEIVKRGKLIWFAAYCLLAGIVALAIA
ncbi:MAG: undecaprenyl-diphosphate phosphatase [Paludibacteraceae bacterium]|nr:undecaprenyl-diphosphate phosphatase [Paludibacteraceae bacterium]